MAARRRSPSHGTGEIRRPTWSAYAACVCAWIFAVPSFYWSLGGKIGTAEVGREAVTASWEADPILMSVVLVTATLKVIGGFLALSFVRPWGRSLPRRLKLIGGWTAAGLLSVYGVVQLGSQALIAVGVIEVSDDFDWSAFWWHLYLWSPWFVLWGALLGLTVLHWQRGDTLVHQTRT